MTCEEIKKSLKECLSLHDLKKAEELFVKEYSCIISSGVAFQYECLEVLLILSIKTDDKNLYTQIYKALDGLEISDFPFYRANLKYWQAEYYFSIGEVIISKKILEDIFSSFGINEIALNTVYGITNLATRLGIDVPYNIDELSNRTESSWNRVKIEFNKAVSAYDQNDYDLARRLFENIILSGLVDNRLTKGYCLIYLARMNKNVKEKTRLYEKAEMVFKIKGNKRMLELVKKELDYNV